MNYPIKVFDTNLASQELFDKVMFLPYMCTRTDDPPCPDRPEVDIRNNYWTHQLYNFVPIDDPGYFDNTGLDASNDPLYLECLTYLEAVCPEMPPRDWLYSAYINCLKAGDTPGVHVDAPYWVEDNKTVLLYLNPDLDHPNFGGETIFYDPNNVKEIAHTSLYVPGRIILFDGSIPHAIRPQSVKAPKFRFTLSLFFQR